MNYLFDTSPTEIEEGRRQKRSGAKGEKPPIEERRPAIDLSSRGSAIYGRADDGFVCPDERCLGTAHDITHIQGGQWRIECAFCGTGQWVKAQKLAEVFRFPGGLFEGLTIDETALQKNGLEYIRFVAARDPSEDVRKACAAWLDSSTPAPYPTPDHKGV